MKILFYIFILCLHVTSATAQSGIFFRDFDLRATIQVAQIEDKNIFIDTYTQWCAPCKRMNRVFQNRELGKYFNKNYLNVKFDMATEKGKALHDRYDVIFLPTMLILDKFGNLLYKHEGMLSKDELLTLAKHYNQPGVAGAPPALKQESNHVTVLPEKEIAKKKTFKKVPSTSNEKVLFQADSEENQKDPKFLYEYAYLMLRLQDSSRFNEAQKYLATQEDWHTEKNIRFIYDFIEDVDSPLFNFQLENRAVFNKIIGKEKVDNSISILVQSKLDEADIHTPVSDLEKWYAYQNPDSSSLKAHRFYLEQLLHTNKSNAMADAAIKYVKDNRRLNTQVLDTYIYFGLKCACSYDKMIQALEQHESAKEPWMLKNIALIYADAGQKKKAIKVVRKALRSKELSEHLEKQLQQIKLSLTK